MKSLKEKAIEETSKKITAVYEDSDSIKYINAYDIVDVHVRWLFFHLCALSKVDAVPIQRWINYVNNTLNSMKDTYNCK